MESEARLKVKFEFGKGAEKLFITMDGSKKIITHFQTKAQWILFKQGWTFKKTERLKG